MVLNFSPLPMHQPMGDKMELPNRLWSIKWRFKQWRRRKFLKRVKPGARNLRVTWSTEKKTQKCRKNLTILPNHLQFCSTSLFYLRKKEHGTHSVSKEKEKTQKEEIAHPAERRLGKWLTVPQKLTNQGARRKIEGILPSSQNAPQTKTEPLQSKQEHQMENTRA